LGPTKAKSATGILANNREGEEEERKGREGRERGREGREKG
jgi:hypothetical protein